MERMSRAFLDSGGKVSQLATNPFIPRKTKEAIGEHLERDMDSGHCPLGCGGSH